MSAIRWYILDTLTGDPVPSPLSGLPYVFTCATKGEAHDYVARHFGHLSVQPMSICEYQALAEMASAAKRFLDSCDADRARAIAAEAMLVVEQSGQTDLLACVEPWLERVA